MFRKYRIFFKTIFKSYEDESTIFNQYLISAIAALQKKIWKKSILAIREVTRKKIRKKKLKQKTAPPQ